MKLAVFLATITVAACATYSTSFGAIERALAAREFDIALQDAERQSATQTDKVLYLLNKGMILRMKGDFSGSNTILEMAKAEMERLYAESISENALSFIVNDSTVSYVGDDYEQVLLHLYMALNYLESGQIDGARVEALQLDVRLRELKESAGGHAGEAFSRYLSAMIFEDLGEWSDAMIAYRKAYEAYKAYPPDFKQGVPDVLKQDLLRLTSRMGLLEESEKYRKEFGPDIPARKTGLEEGELVVVLNDGLAPIKREKGASLLDPVSGVWVRIELPYYESRYNNVASARIHVSGMQAAAEMMENIDGVARKKLEERMPAITARSIARAAAKVTAQKSLSAGRGNSERDGMAEMLGALTLQVAAIATERADTRSWLTLPASVHMARLSLAPGSYTVRIDLLGNDGHVVASRDYPSVTVGKSRKTYLTEHWIPAQPPAARRKK